MSRPTGYVATVLAALVLVGCTGNVVQRPVAAEADCPLDDPQNPQQGRISRDETILKGCREHSIEVGHTTKGAPGYKLAVIELDDQGRFRQDQQLGNLFKLLGSEMAKVNARDEAERMGGVSLVVFVHGWRHNAGVDDPNLEFARTVLYKTVSVENQGLQYTPNGKPRSVVGVYVGWRGKSLTGPGFLSFLELASFWDRKFTAERVATGSVRELFARLKYFRDHSNKNAEMINTRTCGNTDAPPSAVGICPSVRLLIVGHSFGGLLVYNALSESLIRSVTEGDWENGNTTVVGEYADMVMLVNPAVEGARFEPLHQAVRRRRYNARQLPIFVSVTATNDWATGLAFPFGRWWNTIFENERPVNSADPDSAARIHREEREANVHAVGHIERYKTHVLCLASAGADACPPAQRPTSPRKPLVERWRGVIGSADDLGARANCVSALEEALAANYLKTEEITWNTGKDATGRDVRFREFFSTDAKTGLKDDGITLRVHESLESEIKKGDDKRSLLFSPVWIIESNDAQIINGHNDFTRQPFRDFLIQLYHDRVMYGRREILNPEDACPAKR